MSADLDPFAWQCAAELEDNGELRARAEALAAEYRADLPEGDAGLIEAERRIRELKPRTKALHRDFKITMESETQILEPIVYEAEFELHDFIEETPPETRVGERQASAPARGGQSAAERGRRTARTNPRPARKGGAAVISLARLWAVWLLLGTAGELTRLARKLMRQPLSGPSRDFPS